MMKVKLFVVAVLLVGIGRVAAAQQAEQADRQQITRDQLRIAVQEICPVSGQKLGAHGQPIKAKIGQEEVFLCCRGCLRGQVSAEHWATIHANFAKAQAKCPVMDRPLPKNPKWTIVQGQVVFVCCPPCTKKVAADPALYLRKVDELYMASLKAKRAAR